MDSKTFFNLDINIDKTDFIASLNKHKDVLEQDYSFISKILENEKERIDSFRNKAEIILAIYLAFISAILGGNFFGIFSEISKTDDGIVLLFCSGIFIGIVSIIGILQLLLIIHPKMFDVVDPTLIFKKHNSKIDWFKDAITDCLSVYRNNLRRISLISYRIRISIDCLILGVLTTILIIAYGIFRSFFITNLDKTIYIILGIIIGSTLLIVSIYKIVFKSRSYKS